MDIIDQKHFFDSDGFGQFLYDRICSTLPLIQPRKKRKEQKLLCFLPTVYNTILSPVPPFIIPQSPTQNYFTKIATPCNTGYFITSLADWGSRRNRFWFVKLNRIFHHFILTCEINYILTFSLHLLTYIELHTVECFHKLNIEPVFLMSFSSLANLLCTARQSSIYSAILTQK